MLCGPRLTRIRDFNPLEVYIRCRECGKGRAKEDYPKGSGLNFKPRVCIHCLERVKSKPLSNQTDLNCLR
jgi:DNA polymerase III alpha subunit (gram-positive type)